MNKRLLCFSVTIVIATILLLFARSLRAADGQIVNPASEGSGLLGHYYYGEVGSPDTVLATTRIDECVDFHWDANIVPDGMTLDEVNKAGKHMFIEWTGYVKIPEAGTYEFVPELSRMANVRLYIAGHNRIDDENWDRQNQSSWADRFQPGEVPIRICYRRIGGAWLDQNDIHLKWKAPFTNSKLVVISRDYLKPDAYPLDLIITDFDKAMATVSANLDKAHRQPLENVLDELKKYRNTH